MEDFGYFGDEDFTGPEWLDRSDDYNVWEEQQVFLDREGERDAEAEDAADDWTEDLFATVMGAVWHREYDVEPPVWGDVVREVVAALVARGVTLPPEGTAPCDVCGSTADHEHSTAEYGWH